MHIAKVFVIVATILAPAASAGCFTSGATWGSSSNRAKASSFLDGVCNELKGPYPATVSKGRCRNGDENIRFNYRVKHISGGTLTLGKKECIDGLNKEITGCNQGGESSYTNWEYT
jgi:hypothetical protein